MRVDLVKEDLRKERRRDSLWGWKLFCRLDFYSAGHFLWGVSVVRGEKKGGWAVPCSEVLLVFLDLMMGLVREELWKEGGMDGLWEWMLLHLGF